MNRITLKQILSSVNEACMFCPDRHELVQTVYDKTGQKPEVIEEILDRLEACGSLEWIGQEPDLFPAAVIFARAQSNSFAEKLAFWEMLGKPDSFFEEYDLFEDPDLRQAMDRILKEEKKLVSDTLSIIYTDSIIARNKKIPYKNTENPIVPLEAMDYLLKTMPQRGIPIHRDVSKDLQIYFKDSLMHEFNRTCPICGIHMPYMMIASHIKPFRDCGHIYEAADHNNGLLLCRNHDYLFDQGYISFDDNGKLLVSHELKHPEKYTLHDLDPVYMTKNRKLYMKVHRDTLFRD